MKGLKQPKKSIKVLIEMVPQNKRQVLVGLLCLLLTRDSIYEDKTNVSFGSCQSVFLFYTNLLFNHRKLYLLD